MIGSGFMKGLFGPDHSKNTSDSLRGRADCFRTYHHFGTVQNKERMSYWTGGSSIELPELPLRDQAEKVFEIEAKNHVFKATLKRPWPGDLLGGDPCVVHWPDKTGTQTIPPFYFFNFIGAVLLSGELMEVFDQCGTGAEYRRWPMRLINPDGSEFEPMPLMYVIQHRIYWFAERPEFTGDRTGFIYDRDLESIDAFSKYSGMQEVFKTYPLWSAGSSYGFSEQFVDAAIERDPSFANEIARSTEGDGLNKSLFEAWMPK